MDVIQIKPKMIRRTKQEVLAERSDPVKAKAIKQKYYRDYMTIYARTDSCKLYRKNYMKQYRAKKKLEQIKEQEQAIIDKYLLTLASKS